LTLPAPATARHAHRRRLGILVAGALAAILALGPSPAPVGASTVTAASLSAQMISLINKQRTVRGLVGYRTDPRLNALATERASRLASSGILSHAAAGGSIGDALNSRGIQWYGYGEVIGWSGYPWGSQAVSHLVNMWMGSSGHRPLLLSKSYNYVGAGLAYRSANGTVWSSVVFAEAADITVPWARNEGASVTGTTVTFSWRGDDSRLQTRTAGLRSFDVLYRWDDAEWQLIRNDTTATSLTLANRYHGHWYGIRVQAADRRGNLSLWTTELRIWVP